MNLKSGRKDAVISRQLALNVAKAVIIVLIMIFIVSVYSSAEKDYDAAVPDVCAAVFGNDSPEGSQLGSAVEFRENFDMDTAMFEGIVYYRPVSNMDVAECIVAKSGDDTVLDDLSESVEKRVEEQKSVFEGYAPKQYGLLENAVISRKGNYVFYMVSEEADSFYKEFISALQH